jgi:hypothetical protein
MKNILFLFILQSYLLWGQPLTAVHPYYVGHSLINLNMPAMVKSLANGAGKTSEYAYQIGNGANLWYQWDTLIGNEQGILWQNALPTGNFDAMIITEAVPLVGHLMWSRTHDFADSFLITAQNHRPDLRYFIYETWHCNTTGTPQGCAWDNHDDLLWRPRLTADFPLWTGIMDTLKNHHPNAQVWMVPAGQAFGMLVDSIEAGNVPTISDFTSLFTDDIHLTEVGNYFVACVVYACLFRQSPEGLTNQTFSEWGISFNPPSADLALKMQQIAWKTVLNLSARTGVNATVSTQNPLFFNEIKLSPNPVSANEEIFISSKKEIIEVEIYDSQGRFMWKKEAIKQFSLPKSGLYFIKINLNDGASELRKILVF